VIERIKNNERNKIDKILFFNKTNFFSTFQKCDLYASIMI